MRKIIQKQLGELLVENQVITPENLQEALKIQKEKGGLLGEIFISLGYASEQAIAQALMVQYGFPYLPLKDYEIDPKTAEVIPEKLAREHGVVAVDRLGDILTIAMANPLDTQTIQEVEKTTHLNAQVFVTTPTDIKEAIKHCYKNH
jgi:type IV pilus assembly protein PilB